jgi:hypothetical protein
LFPRHQSRSKEKYLQQKRSEERKQKRKEKKKAVTDNEIFHLISVSTENISSLMIAQITK